MNILSVIDTIRELSGRSGIEIDTELHSQYHREIFGSISEHTTLTGLRFGLVYRNRYVLKVLLTHKCPISSFNRKKIKKAPYYCKQCAQPIITKEQGVGMALPIDPSVVPKIQIGIGGPDYFSDENKDFDIGNMVLTPYKGWVHKCTGFPPNPVRQHRTWLQTKQTITSLPFKCKICRLKIGEEGFNFTKMVALASVLKVNQ